MEKSALGRVQNLAEKLSPEERKVLVDYLANLPDSGIATTVDPPEPLLSPEDRAKVQERANSEEVVVVSSQTYAAIFHRGHPLFQVFFFADGFRRSRLESHSWRNAPPSENAVRQVREILALHNQPQLSDDEIIQAAKAASAQIFDAETVRLILEFSARLPHMAWLLYEAGMKIVEIGFRNDFAGKTGQRKKPLREIVKELEPFWKKIKAHLNLGPGGRQNVKHQWSARDHACLAVQYERLKPIWWGAKKAAKQAQEARELSRRKTWKEQVAAAYKDAELPDDLIAQLAPDINAQPADLALTHAARLCVPVSYSTKVLKQKLGKLNPVSRASRNQPKTREVH